MRKIFGYLTLLLTSSFVFAGSTINPSVPIANSSLSSAPLRTNFAAAYSDINNILGQYAGATSPASPSRYQYWLDTSTNPPTLKIYDGSVWVSVARLNTVSHTWSPVGSYSGSPISTTYGGTGADLHAATGAVSMSSGVTSVGTLPSAYLPAPLSSLAGFNINGLITQTAANTFTSRTLTGTSNEITVANGSGVSGNPMLSLPSSLTFTGKTITGGTYSSPTINTATINSATMTSPALGTPISGVATNLIGTASGLTAGTVITNANLTGPITSSGNTTSVAAQTGTGSTFVMQTSPTINTPTFTAPVLGTPASGVATNLTGTAAGLTAGNVTTNANLTGVITSVGNATSIASQTGTGTKFVVDTSPTLITPTIGAAVATSINFGQTSLNFYQEGAWTPGVAFGGGTTGITYSNQTASYTVIGNRVFVQGRINLTSKGSSTGAATLTGLPFAASSTTSLNSASAILMNNLGTSIMYVPEILIVPSATVGAFYTMQLTGASSTMADTDFSNTTAINFSFNYQK